MFIFSTGNSRGENEREQVGVRTGEQAGIKRAIGFSPLSVRTAAVTAPYEVVG